MYNDVKYIITRRTQALNLSPRKGGERE
jgi:hypothetical protein